MPGPPPSGYSINDFPSPSPRVSQLSSVASQPSQQQQHPYRPAEDQGRPPFKVLSTSQSMQLPQQHMPPSPLPSPGPVHHSPIVYDKRSEAAASQTSGIRKLPSTRTPLIKRNISQLSDSQGSTNPRQLHPPPPPARTPSPVADEVGSLPSPPPAFDRASWRPFGGKLSLPNASAQGSKTSTDAASQQSVNSVVPNAHVPQQPQRPAASSAPSQTAEHKGPQSDLSGSFVAQDDLDDLLADVF